jgi:hypothetical protein
MSKPTEAADSASRSARLRTNFPFTIKQHVWIVSNLRVLGNSAAEVRRRFGT